MTEGTQDFRKAHEVARLLVFAHKLLVIDDLINPAMARIGVTGAVLRLQGP
jgi:hypothetical protein